MEGIIFADNDYPNALTIQYNSTIMRSMNFIGIEYLWVLMLGIVISLQAVPPVLKLCGSSRGQWNGTTFEGEGSLQIRLGQCEWQDYLLE